MTKKRIATLYSIVFLLAIVLSLVLVFFFNQDKDSTKPNEELQNEQDIKNEEPRDPDSEPRDPDSEPSKDNGDTPENKLEKKVETIMENMSLREKIGQLMIVGFQSSQVDDHITEMITDYNVGGVIYYDRNMKTPRQVAELSNDLQELASQTQHKLPLMLSIDQEGGAIVRMKEHVTPIPSQQTLGQQGDAAAVYHTAYLTGQELSTMGIHVNFAPVLDLSDQDSRSFGSDPEKANLFGQEVIKGLVDSGMVATLKHFPGHGRTNVDPHKDTSSVEVDRFDLENQDLYPFKKTIEQIDHQSFFVMVTHVKYPAYDEVNPASISPTIIQELLRDELGYTGIVVTDDLEMGAVNKYFTYEDLGYKAVEAGADILLVCHTLENQKKVFNGILEAVETNQLSEERIDEAVKRILMYKLSSLKNTHVDPSRAEKMVG
ncbi:beta-N-acetylhexosaminidase [Bacillus tuaregi]|uniref:beta-N-acetylhexosaminidase n=1 Tax=Bacillus tuaregi TaxID=1816695 RepID=UPI000A68F04B|nr:beta-N-acetylhexosaminidase [Bacillus tuaregi]